MGSVFLAPKHVAFVKAANSSSVSRPETRWLEPAVSDIISALGIHIVGLYRMRLNSQHEAPHVRSFLHILAVQAAAIQ
jgi:hypothetical protein